MQTPTTTGTGAPRSRTVKPDTAKVGSTTVTTATTKPPHGPDTAKAPSTGSTKIPPVAPTASGKPGIAPAGKL